MIISDSFYRLKRRHPNYGSHTLLLDFIINTDSSFLWETTPEGNDFWRNLNIQWESYLRKEGFTLI
jgi:hypothetical protein